jgi:hypothetical protein
MSIAVCCCIPAVKLPQHPPVDTSGWYQITINSDTYGDYDVSTLTLGGVYVEFWLLDQTTINSNYELSPVGLAASDDYFSLKIITANQIKADRDYSDQTGNTQRCQLTWDPTTRKWNRIDNDDYHLYPVNQSASYSHSLGVCTFMPQFLVDIRSSDGIYNDSGIKSEFPKKGMIWLYSGETISDVL